MERLRHHTEPGDMVADVFGGSGTAIIAAEQWAQGVLMELNALYCDIIATRWEKFTGKKAERIATRRPHDHLATPYSHPTPRSPAALPSAARPQRRAPRRQLGVLAIVHTPLVEYGLPNADLLGRSRSVYLEAATNSRSPTRRLAGKNGVQAEIAMARDLCMPVAIPGADALVDAPTLPAAIDNFIPS